MKCLQYEEGAKPWCRPRHPFVSWHDIGIASFAFVFVYFTENWLRWYFVVVAVMFAISALHHWLPNRGWHYRLDRSAIQVMIAGTTLPYTEYIFANGAGWWFGVLWIWALVFILIKIVFGKLMCQGLWPSVVYAGTGLLAIIVMLQAGLQSQWWLTLFWLGVGLYGLQLFSYNRKWFDFYLGKFGHREVQHLILLAAVSCHSFAALCYTY